MRPLPNFKNSIYHGDKFRVLTKCTKYNPVLKKKTSGNYVSTTWDFNIKHFTEF